MIIYIDEIDAVSGSRGGLNSHSEREQTLNQVLVEIDGFDNNTHVIVIAATNRSDMLDPAPLRPGRFDRRVILGLPDVADRADILGVHIAASPWPRRLVWTTSLWPHGVSVARSWRTSSTRSRFCPPGAAWRRSHGLNLMSQ